jgi:hypothetical protein
MQQTLLHNKTLIVKEVNYLLYKEKDLSTACKMSLVLRWLLGNLKDTKFAGCETDY